MTPWSVVAAMLVALPCASTLAASANPPEKRQELPEVASRSYGQNFKDLVLSSCVAAAYASEPKAAADAGATAGGLDSTWTNYDPELAAGEINKLIEKYLARQYNSIQGPSTRLDLMKCLDLYHGKDLDLLAKRVVPRPARTYRQDNELATKR
ncbi:MAG TPA: T6SS amidase immunity protein Tai4 family protein [Ideonella sp.]|uniref:T6SS amidase immunity protein Tai4 family protein n=1 Tax=Ideonella sp. TaxID=1929293 RepID=UPI002E3508D9|nr:T6SS amidase immunity protein Tai4 family protein [Ideonella sp.]HEX5683708.1 T6SS amidase immunity protein Tai4 family protein [Ideonella sp.]